MATVLIVDDEKSIRTTVGAFLKDAGYEVIVAADAEQAKRWVAQRPLDVALIDILLGNGSGLDVARDLRDRQMLLDVVSQAAAARAREAEYAMLLRERERAHAELEKQVRVRTADLHALAARLQVVREEERQALARELHDNFGQNLTALQIDLQWLARRLQATHSSDGAVVAKIAAMTPLAERLIVLTQTVCAALRPGMLDDLGLLAAIEWQAEDWEQRTGLTCVVSLPIAEVVVDPGHALALFRIFQEALTNVVRHAQATRVDVRLQTDDREVYLEVQDNGRGFTPEAFPASKALGLLSMRERAAGFAGAVNILSELGKGTTVQIRMPAGQPDSTSTAA